MDYVWAIGPILTMEFLLAEYRSNILLICTHLQTPSARALAQLVSLGEFNGGTAWELFRTYRDWGLLHLLILSGSQFYSFTNAWENVWRTLLRLTVRQSFPAAVKWSVLPAAYIFLKTLNFSPPLVRCALIFMTYALWGPYSRRSHYLLIAAFILQIIFFEQLQISTSAFLSWLAFLTLIFAKEAIKNSVLRTLFITIVLQLTIWYLRQQDFFLA